MYKKDFIIFLSIILIGSFVFYFFYDFERHKYDGVCNSYENYYKMELNSIVLRKYVDDRNHRHTYIHLMNNMLDSLVLFNIDTYVFESINVGDSLTKKSNSDSLHVYDPINQLRKSFIIVYGCPKARRDSIAIPPLTVADD